MERYLTRGRTLALVTLFILSTLAVPVAAIHAQTVVATIATNSPAGVGVNPTTSRIYVANSADDTVSVIQDTFQLYLPVVANNASSF